MPLQANFFSVVITLTYSSVMQHPILVANKSVKFLQGYLEHRDCLLCVFRTFRVTTGAT